MLSMEAMLPMLHCSPGVVDVVGKGLIVDFSVDIWY